MEVISIHLPKTAGVSFRKLLQRVYGETAVVFDYGDRILDPDALYHVDRPRWQQTRRDPWIATAENAKEVRVLHGHFAASKYASHFPEARRIVWLRDPVARLVSHYHYWRGLPHAGHGLHRRLLEEDLTLEQFAALGPMRDSMNRLFLDGVALSTFDFVGIQECFNADLAVLGRLLGWPSSAASASSVVENRGESSAAALASLDRTTRRRLEELNPEDTMLYRNALELRRRRQEKSSG